jgi:mediator of RNA polymerase II transcription subunit 16
MLRHPKTGHWDMTEPSDTPVVAPEGRTFQHIQFSGVGTNMAVADDRGSVHVRYIVGPLGKMPLAVPSIGQFETAGGDLDVVVGLHWLPLWPAEFKVSRSQASRRNEPLITM